MSRRVALAGVLVLALIVGTVTPGLSATLPAGGSSAGGGGFGNDLLNFFGLGRSAGSGGYEEGEGLAFENQAKRRKAFLQAHMDSNGEVRPNLWRRGIRAFHRLETSATWRNRPRTSAQDLKRPGVQPGTNPVVVGVRWKQIGPAPLRIDDRNTTQGGDNFWFQGDGPDSGMVSDIAIDPRGSTDRTVYIATNDGGIWKTTNGGLTWQTNTDDMPSLSMGAVAIDAVNRQVVYAGSGNGFDGGCKFTKGAGLYKSVDGGATWSVASTNLPNNVMINRIRVLAGNIVLVGTNQGLFRSVNGGVTFGANAPQYNDGQPLLQGNATDVDISTVNPSTIYASMSTADRCGRAAPGGTSGIFVSTDGGATFPTNLFTNTGAPAANSSYITFSQGTNVSQTFYASVANAARGWDGLYRSTNSGTSWTRMAAADGPAAASFNGCQCTYDQVLGVDPLDANRVYLGFQELWLSTDGGSSFPNSNTTNATGAVTYRQVHWDQHAVVFSPASHVSSSATTTPLWIGHDGGVSRSSDGGTNWDNLNETIATNLFKDIDIGRGAGNNGFTYGGAQDTGTSQHRPTDPGTDWRLGIDGDGLSVAVDPSNPSHVLSVDNGLLIATTDAGSNWTFPAFPGGTVGLLEWDPTDAQNVWAADSPGNLRGFFSGPQLFRSTDNGGTFNSITTFTPRITAIAIDPQNSNNVWLGFSDGTVRRSTDALAATPTFSLLANQPTSPGGQVSAIAVDPTDSNTAVVTYEGIAGVAADQLNQHVWRTTDLGATAWVDITGTVSGAQNLPDLPTHSVVIDGGTTPHSIIVSNDAGVLRSVDNGVTWQVLGTGMPTVDSTTLVMDTSVTPPVLRVGTYGRSVFELVSSNGPVLDVKGDLAFGNLQTGRSDTRELQLFNVGTANLDISSFAHTAGSTEFSVHTTPSLPATIAPGQKIVVKVAYAPSDEGADTATFTVSSNDPNNQNLEIPASGSGMSAEALGGGDGNEDCARRYVAAGDGVVVGTDIGNDSGATQKDRYSDKLLNDKLKKITGNATGDPWCLYNTSTEPATTDTYVQGSNSQQSQAWTMRPNLITQEIGRQNNVIVDHVTKCLNNIRDHDFLDANTCALAVLANTGAWDKFKRDLGAILNNYKTQMSGNPNLVVAVLGYYNPYPTATSVATKIPAFCAKLVDTIPTCVARWILLPPALVTLDQVVKKLNEVITNVVRQFTIASQGRFFMVNPYDKFKDHCMKIDVEIKTTVYHPPSTVHDHDSSKNFGCDQNWVVKDGTTGTKSPFPYLTPAVNGVLLKATQTTKEMGINPNKKGHECLMQMIWETVKNKLGVPEKQDLANACTNL